jgi:hypothetical protein
VVAKAPTEVRDFVVVKPETNEVVARPRGTSGEKDQPADPTVAKKVIEEGPRVGADEPDGDQDANRARVQQYRPGEQVPDGQGALKKNTGEDGVTEDGVTGEVENGDLEKGDLKNGTIPEGTVEGGIADEQNLDKTDDQSGVVGRTDAGADEIAGTGQDDGPQPKPGTGSGTDPVTGSEPEVDGDAKVPTVPGAHSDPDGESPPSDDE